MAWLSSVSADNTIVTDETQYVQKLFSSIAGYLNKRTVTRTTTQYVGLTSAAADTQLTTSAGTAGCISAKKSKQNDAGAYMVTEEIETYGAYEYDSTITPVPPP